MRQRVIRSARITLYVSANVIVDKSGNYYQYNAATHSYNQVKKCDGHDGCHSRGTQPDTGIYGAGATFWRKRMLTPEMAPDMRLTGTTGALTLTYNSVYHRLSFSTDDGTFSKVGNVADAKSVGLNMSPVRRTVRKYQCGLQHLQEYEQRRQVHCNDEQRRYRRNNWSR